jgi:hypothetical protein
MEKERRKRRKVGVDGEIWKTGKRSHFVVENSIFQNYLGSPESSALLKVKTHLNDWVYKRISSHLLIGYIE